MSRIPMITNVPRISVVVPLYNKEKYIRRAIDSVLAQTFADYQLIVVNDGSTDNGPVVVRGFKDSRVRLINQENRGASAARNRGIKETRVELIAFLDADDEWLPDFLSTIVELAGRFPDAGVYATGWRWLRGSGRYAYRDVAIGGDRDQCGCYFDLFTNGGDVCSSSIAVRRSVFDTLPGFRIGQHLHQDLDMWFRIGLRYKFACSPKVCALYHSYVPDSATHRVIFGKYSPLYISLQEMRDDAGIDPSIRAKAENHLMKHLGWLVAATLYRGTGELARSRLTDYRAAFGTTPQYVRLLCLSMVPGPLRRALYRLRQSLIRYYCVVKNIAAEWRSPKAPGAAGQKQQ